MITQNNISSSVDYSYTNESNCTATGKYQIENGVLSTVDINGQYHDGNNGYNFFANRDSEGNVNFSGVPASVIAPVAVEVAEILHEIDALVNPPKSGK